MFLTKLQNINYSDLKNNINSSAVQGQQLKQDKTKTASKTAPKARPSHPLGPAQWVQREGVNLNTKNQSPAVASKLKKIKNIRCLRNFSGSASNSSKKYPLIFNSLSEAYNLIKITHFGRVAGNLYASK